MQTIIKQIKRIISDDGRNDRSFYDQEYRLRDALNKVNEASEEVVKAAEKLSYLLSSDGRLIH